MSASKRNELSYPVTLLIKRSVKKSRFYAFSRDM